MSFLSSTATLNRSAIFRKCIQQFLDKPNVRHAKFGRGGVRGLRHEDNKNLATRLEEMNYKDPELHRNIDIGFRLTPSSRKELLPQRIKANSIVKQDINLELAAKDGTLEVPLDKVHEEWQTSQAAAAIHLRESAYYFNVFSDLFGDAHFTPVLPVIIAYGLPGNDEISVPVCRGNIIKPSEASKAPRVSYEAKDNEFYTLVMTTPDCHLTEENGEYVHWFIGNIPGNNLDKGEEIVDYIQPIPPRGAGFCRYVFVLYKQDARIDLSKYRRPKPCTNLAARTFKTHDFYRELEDVITPCGLAFYQADWDSNITSFYHNVLEMKEPIFEYDFEPLTVPEYQRWFPHRKPFNIYLDKYKEEKVLQKELLLEKLKERHPFEPPPKTYKYPLAFKISHEFPSWKRDEIRKKRMREGKFKFM